MSQFSGAVVSARRTINAAGDVVLGGIRGFLLVTVGLTALIAVVVVVGALVQGIGAWFHQETTIERCEREVTAAVAYWQAQDRATHVPRDAALLMDKCLFDAVTRSRH